MSFPFLSGRVQIADGGGQVTTPMSRWMQAVQDYVQGSSTTEADIDALELRTDALETRATDLETAVDTANDDIGDLDTRLDGFDASWTPVAVATLDPVAPAGARAFVNDAAAPVFGSVVLGGGAEEVPVYRTTTDWKVG